jgi:hypothetical protein
MILQRLQLIPSAKYVEQLRKTLAALRAVEK